MNQINLDGFWLPRQSSTFAVEYDHAWTIITWMSIVLFAIVVGAMCYFVVRYRRRGPNDEVSHVDHNLRIEIIWTAVPTVMVLFLFWIGFVGFINASVPPGDAYEISCVGQKWMWSCTYPNGVTTPGELRVPINKPVKIIISAKDVLHSFFIPEFRVKKDAIPGAYTTVWFTATDLGEKLLTCAEYCGDDHSKMMAKVIVLDEPSWNKWLEEGANEGKDLPPAEWGAKLYTKAGCVACHSIDGTPKVGPSFKGAFGRSEKIIGGPDVTVDENYIRESILQPQAKVVAGFQPVMPTFQGLLKDEQINALIAYLKTLK